MVESVGKRLAIGGKPPDVQFPVGGRATVPVVGVCRETAPLMPVGTGGP